MTQRKKTEKKTTRSFPLLNFRAVCFFGVDTKECLGKAQRYYTDDIKQKQVPFGICKLRVIVAKRELQISVWDTFVRSSTYLKRVK